MRKAYRSTARQIYPGKRMMDVVIACICLFVSFPLILIAAGIIFGSSGRNPFFIQERSGLAEKPFRIIKLRTLFPYRPRLQAFGFFLRKFSVDELPQLLNVIKGDMSLVGPRPLLTEYLPLYDSEQRRRHEVRPGITGWAQINGRNTLSWQEKFVLDTWYVEHVSLKLDLKILALTFSCCLHTQQVKPEGQEKFAGNSCCC